MTLYLAARSRSRAPTHPGMLIAEGIAALDKSKAEVARLLGISRQHLYDIVNETKPVSPSVAARLGKLFGDGTEIWLRMQAAHDAWYADHSVDVSGIPTLTLPPR